MTPKITVASPVYKTAKYLRPCIESVLAQTFCDFELLLIDNGGTDECPAICDEYAAKDSRVRVIHLSENIGIAGARNTGLHEARGEFLMYIDSDDFIEPNALEVMHARILADASDFVVCGVVWDDWTKPQKSLHYFPDSILSSPVEKISYAYTISYVFIHLWNKLFSMRFLRENHFEFSTACGYVDDFVFAAQTLESAQRISVIPDGFYVHYIHGENEGLKKLPFELYSKGQEVYLASLARLIASMNEAHEGMSYVIFQYVKWARSIVRAKTDLDYRMNYLTQFMKEAQPLFQHLEAPKKCWYMQKFITLMRENNPKKMYRYMRVWYSPLRKIGRFLKCNDVPAYRGGIRNLSNNA